MISACNCNQHGSTGACDDNGKCNCRAHFKNDKCDACTDGSEIFPSCVPGAFYIAVIPLCSRQSKIEC